MKELFFIISAILILYSCDLSNEKSEKQSNYKIAEQYIEDFQPEMAIPYLQKIEYNDPNYKNAQELLGTIGKLYQIEIENAEDIKKDELEISDDIKKKLAIFQSNWAKEQLKIWETFLVDYEITGLTNIDFILSKEASEHGSLSGHINAVVPSLKSSYEESLSNAKLTDYPINISLKRMQGISNKNLEVSKNGWLPTEYLWYNVVLYFGEGQEKRFIGTVIEGIMIDGNKYVVIKTKSGMSERKTLEHIKNASYYIKADDSNIKKRVLKYN